jgi:hypothetical protein
LLVHSAAVWWLPCTPSTHCCRNIKTLVLDEADEMLNKGFKEQIYDIYRYLPPETQVGGCCAGSGVLSCCEAVPVRGFRGGRGEQNHAMYCHLPPETQVGPRNGAAAGGFWGSAAGSASGSASGGLQTLVVTHPHSDLPCLPSCARPCLQVVLVSATLPHEVLEMTHKFMTDPVRILVKRDELTLEVGALPDL